MIFTLPCVCEEIDHVSIEFKFPLSAAGRTEVCRVIDSFKGILAAPLCPQGIEDLFPVAAPITLEAIDETIGRIAQEEESNFSKPIPDDFPRTESTTKGNQIPPTIITDEIGAFISDRMDAGVSKKEIHVAVNQVWGTSFNYMKVYNWIYSHYIPKTKQQAANNLPRVITIQKLAGLLDMSVTHLQERADSEDWDLSSDSLEDLDYQREYLVNELPEEMLDGIKEALNVIE